MSMIGKLRQVSEFDLAKCKNNPAQMLRALAGAQQPSGGAGFAALRETLQQSPVVKKMLEFRQQQKVLSREEQAEVQQEMMKLKQAVQTDKEGLGKVSAGGLQSAGTPAVVELDLHKSWHCLHFMFTGKVEDTDGTPLGDAIWVERKLAARMRTLVTDRQGRLLRHRYGTLQPRWRNFQSTGRRKNLTPLQRKWQGFTSLGTKQRS